MVEVGGEWVDKFTRQPQIKITDTHVKNLIDGGFNGPVRKKKPKGEEIVRAAARKQSSRRTVNEAELKQKLESLNKGIAEMDAHEQAVREFMVKATQYVEMPKLTSELLRTFIRKIEVYEKPEKYSRTCGNPAAIYYKFQMEKLETLSVMFGAYEENAEKDISASK